MGKVRIFFPFVGGDLIGGSHHSALQLAAHLDPDRFEPIIALHNEAGALGEYVNALGLSYRIVKDPPVFAANISRAVLAATLPGYLARSVPRLVGLLHDLDVQIVHTNDGRMHSSWALPAKLARIPHVWHHRQDPDAQGVNRLAPLVADRILSVSHFARPSRPILPIDSRFAVIRSPFDFSSAPPDRQSCHDALCAELGVARSAVLLGYFGVLTTRKRPEHFVRAVAAVSKALPDRAVHGLIFGASKDSGPDIAGDCRSLATQLGVSDTVHLMGYRSPAAPAMAGMDALLITALSEPFGRTLIEAMHLGTPVVATDHGGNPEAITNGKTGFLVDPDDAEGFVEPVLRLVRDPVLVHQITSSARCNVHESMGLACHVASVSAVYEDLISKGGRADAQAA